MDGNNGMFSGPQNIIEQAKVELEGIENVMLFEKESEMIDTFLTLIEDADILSCWNSEGYDIPSANRTSLYFQDDTRRFLWQQLPKNVNLKNMKNS